MHERIKHYAFMIAIVVATVGFLQLVRVSNEMNTRQFNTPPPNFHASFYGNTSGFNDAEKR